MPAGIVSSSLERRASTGCEASRDAFLSLHLRFARVAGFGGYFRWIRAPFRRAITPGEGNDLKVSAIAYSSQFKDITHMTARFRYDNYQRMKKTYQGSCHCESVKFEVDASLESVRVCNCSICSMRGALIHRVENNELRIKTPIEELRTYEWHTNTAKDFFCPNCGILPFRRPRALTHDEVAKGMKPFDGWAINVRCLRGVDFSALTVIEINGRDLD
jgi:hypothetical protein